MPFPLETERLTIRPWQKSDTANYITMSEDLGFNCFSLPGYFTVKNEAEALVRVEKQMTDFEKTGTCKFLVFDKATDKIAGTCGIGPYVIRDENVFELGYRFMLDAWDKGFASESARRILSFGLDELKLDRIVAFALRQNRGSLRIIQKLGFERVGTCPHVGLEHELFEIQRKNRSGLQPFAG